MHVGVINLTKRISLILKTCNQTVNFTIGILLKLEEPLGGQFAPPTAYIAHLHKYVHI
jgi:hypothetical protein